jgi:hypothetical protein
MPFSIAEGFSLTEELSLTEIVSSVLLACARLFPPLAMLRLKNQVCFASHRFSSWTSRLSRVPVISSSKTLPDNFP